MRKVIVTCAVTGSIHPLDVSAFAGDAGFDRSLRDRSGTRFEFECCDIGHLYTAAHFLDRGLLKAPLFIQSAFGIRGGIGTHPEDVLMMRRTADRCSATTTSGPCSAQGARRCRWRRRTKRAGSSN